MKNVKYFAGFFDADGSFDIRPVKRDEDCYQVNLKATIYQKTDFDAPLHTFAEEWETEVKYDGRGLSNVTLQGSKARRFMEQVKNHLVIKRNVVEYLLSLDKLKFTKDELKELRPSIKAARAVSSGEKNFPSRQWMAGYVDGDGCISSSYRKTDGVLEFKLNVCSHHTQAAGLYLLKKFFGGYITQGIGKGENTLSWQVSLGQTKAEEVLTYFIKHSQIKRAQLEYALGVIRSGKHFRRRGATPEGNLRIHKTLQSMKRVPATTNSQGSLNS